MQISKAPLSIGIVGNVVNLKEMLLHVHSLDYLIIHKQSEKLIYTRIYLNIQLFIVIIIYNLT